MTFREFLGSTMVWNGRQTANQIIDKLDAYLDYRDAQKMANSLRHSVIPPVLISDGNCVAHVLQAELDTLRKLKRDQELHHERTLSAIGHEAAKTKLMLDAEMTQTKVLRRELDAAQSKAGRLDAILVETDRKLRTLKNNHRCATKRVAELHNSVLYLRGMHPDPTYVDVDGFTHLGYKTPVPGSIIWVDIDYAADAIKPTPTGPAKMLETDLYPVMPALFHLVMRECKDSAPDTGRRLKNMMKLYASHLWSLRP